MRLFPCHITITVAEEYTEPLFAGGFFDTTHHRHGKDAFKIVRDQANSQRAILLETLGDDVWPEVELGDSRVDTFFGIHADMSRTIQHLRNCRRRHTSKLGYILDSNCV